MNKVVAEANRTLGFIKRNLYSCSKNVKNLGYKTSTKELTQKLESVQNRGARFVTDNYKRGSSVTEIKRELEWESLEERRKVNRVSILHQAL